MAEEIGKPSENEFFEKGDPNPPKAEQTIEDNKEQVAESDLSFLERAEKAHEGMKAENDRREKLLAEEKIMLGKQMLGGRSNAGKTTEEPVEETPGEHRRRIEKELAEGKFNK